MSCPQLLPTAVAAACLLAVTASAAAPAPKAIDACSLLTADRVASVTALKVAPGKRHDEGVTRDGAYSSTCLWLAPLAAGEVADATQPMGGHSFTILNVINWPGGPKDAKTYIDTFRRAAETHVISRKPTDLKIGDEGLWWGNGVAARKNAVSFGISVHLTTGDIAAHRGMEEALAKVIAAKL